MSKRISDLPRFLLPILLILPLKSLSQSMADTTERDNDFMINFAPAPQDSFLDKEIEMRFNMSLFFFFILLQATTSSAFSARSDSTATRRPYLIALVVADAAKTAEWYEDKFGLHVTRTMEFPEYDSLKIVFMELHGTKLELIQKKTSFAITKYVPDYSDKTPLRGIAKVAFWVRDVATLAGVLRSKGVKFLAGPFDDENFNLRSIIVEDLEGNALQFNQPLHAETLKDD